MDKLQILIQSAFDKQKEEARLSQQLKSFKLDPLKLKVSIDSDSLKKELAKIKVTLEQASKGSGSKGIESKIFDKDKLEKQGREYFLSVTNIVDRVKKYYSSMAGVEAVNVDVFKNSKKQITGFTAEVKKATGEIEKLSFQKAKFSSQNWKSNQSGFVFSSALGADDNSGANLQKKLDTLSRLSNKLKDMQQQAYSLSRPINQAGNVDTLNKKYDAIANAIQNVSNQSGAMSKNQARDIGNMISEAERLRKEYQKKEYSSTKLAPTSLVEEIEKTSASFTTNEKKWEKAGILTGDFKTKVDGLKTSLSTLNSEGDIQHFANRFSVLSETARQLTMDNPTKSFKQFNAEVQKTIAVNDMQKYLNDNTKAAKAYSGEFEALGRKLSKVTNPDELRAWKNEYKALTSTISATGQEGLSMLGNLTKNVQKFASWLLTSGGVMLALKSVKDIVANVIILDKSITSLRMATNGSYEETSALLDTYSQMGKELGATTAEIANSADSWLRQGKTVSETNELISASMVLSKIGAMDSALATQNLTSAILGYKLETKNAIDVVSKLAAVDLVSATSSSGLALSMSYVANNANLAGVSMDKLIGYLALVGSVTQKNMESIGTSFNNIFSRMGNVKLGRLTDPETDEDISNVETVLNNLNIKLRDSKSEFRNFGDVLDDVGGRWNTYSSVQQRAIAVAFAGIRNQENFLVLMEGYGKAIEYANVATNSQGVAMQKMEAYQESLEAKTKALTASFEDLSRAVLSTDAVGGFLDAGTSILETITSITKEMGLIPTLIGTISAAMSISGKNAGRPKVNMPSYVRLQLVA